MTATSCEVLFDGSETGGGDFSVTVEDANGFSDRVPFRAWFPTTVAVQAQDPILNRIQDGCDDWTFQRTELQATAAFTRATATAGSDQASLLMWDVTTGAEFCVDGDDTNVVAINGSAVYVFRLCCSAPHIRSTHEHSS